MPGHDRIRLIDPASYQGPSAFEGLDSLINTINNIQRQEEAIERADEQQAYEREQVEIARQREDEQQAYIRAENEKDRQIQNENLLLERKNFVLNQIDRDYENDLMGKGLALQALKKTNPDFEGDLSLDVRANQLISQSETIADVNEAFTKLYLNPDATSYDYQDIFNKVDLSSLPPTLQQNIGQQYIQNLKVQQEKEEKLISENPILLGLSARLKTLATTGKFGKEYQEVSGQYNVLYNQLKTPSPVAKDQISIDDLSEEKRRYIFSLDDKGVIDLEDLTLGELYESEDALAQALGIDFDDMISMSGPLKPGDPGFFTQEEEIEKQQELTEIETQRNLLRKVNKQIQLLKSDRKTSGRTRDEVAELNKEIKKFEDQKKQIQNRIFVLR
jgi:hypothetical protein